MKAYLITTGTLFGLLALVHVWRIVAEWPAVFNDVGAAAEGGVGVVAGALCVWAWRLARV